MHEVSLVHSIITAVAESALVNGVTRVTLVKLVVGRECLVLPDALHFAFAALRRDPLAPDAQLLFEERPGRELSIEYYEGEP